MNKSLLLLLAALALSNAALAADLIVNGSFESPDVLTTPGHAMKVSDHARAQGAILGKAMTGLKSGQGFVLVLVSLQ